MKLFKVEYKKSPVHTETGYAVASDYNLAAGLISGCGLIISVSVIADTDEENGYCYLAYDTQDIQEND